MYVFFFFEWSDPSQQFKIVQVESFNLDGGWMMKIWFDLITLPLREWVIGPTMKAPFFIWQCKLRKMQAKMSALADSQITCRKSIGGCSQMMLESSSSNQRSSFTVCLDSNWTQISGKNWFCLFEIYLILNYSCLLCRHGLAGLLHFRYCCKGSLKFCKVFLKH